MEQPGPINVVLFGEAGVGKSSVVNLISGEDRAEVSSGIDNCTMHSTPYDIALDGIKFTVFDTMGLNEPTQDVTGYVSAVEKAQKLISELSSDGGIHLLLFCMRGGRVTGTVRSNYQLFHEFLCEKKVPIALVITCLEQEEEMEDWWIQEGENVESLGLRSDDHVCITAVRGGSTEQERKYLESQSKVRELLKRYSSQNKGYSPEEHSWFARLAEKMVSFVKKCTMQKTKGLQKILMGYNLDRNTANRIVSLIQRSAEGKTRNHGK